MRIRSEIDENQSASSGSGTAPQHQGNHGGLIRREGTRPVGSLLQLRLHMLHQLLTLHLQRDDCGLESQVLTTHNMIDALFVHLD